MKLTNRLKNYLIAEELKKLEEEIALLKDDIINKDEIILRISPIIDTILKRKFDEDEAILIGLFSEHITNILEVSSIRHPKKLHHSLNKTISKNFENELIKNRDKMVDVMYPVLGKMIYKYVSSAMIEMMERINHKIETQLPYKYYKTKILSKISGSSEAEILFMEENTSTIEAIFIIDKKSGMLICEEHLDGNKIKNPHMVASMASAIKDFIDEWIKTNKSNSTVEILSYGDSVLYIENAGTVYMIAFLNKMPKELLKNKIRKLFASLLTTHSISFQKYSGNDEDIFLQEIKKELKNFLSQELKLTNDYQKKSFVEKCKEISFSWKYLMIAISIIIASIYLFLMPYNTIELPRNNTLVMYYQNNYTDTYLRAIYAKKPYIQDTWLHRSENSFDDSSLNKIKALLDFTKRYKNIAIEIIYFDEDSKPLLLNLINLFKEHQISNITYRKGDKTKSFMLEYRLISIYRGN